MACGIPVISTDCKSGPKEILAPETDLTQETKNIYYGQYGILVPVCDDVMNNYNDSLTKEEEKMGESIIQILKNPSLLNEYSDKGFMRVRDFSKENIIKVWEEELN